MRAFLESLPWVLLVPAALLLALAPFRPEPHLVEKLRMLAAGTLKRPIDVFDLLLHAAPLALLVLKAAFALSGAKGASAS